MSPPPFEVAQEPPKRRGTTIAIVVGLVVMGSCLVFMILGAAVLFPVFAQARRAALRRVGTARMHQLGLGAMIYAQDNDDHLPVADRWMDALASTVNSEKAFHAPGLNGIGSGGTKYGVSFLKSLSGAKLSTIQNPAHAVMFFDSTLLERNASSGLETVPKPPRYGTAETGGNVFAFADGHAELLDAARETDLKSPTVSKSK